jgi:hypothetical protein
VAVSGPAGGRRRGLARGDAGRSRQVEANLEVAGGEGQDLGGRPAQIAPGLPPPESEVLGRADAVREGVLKQTAVLDEWAEQMADR